MPTIERPSVHFRAGAWVEVRSWEEIRDTLDENGALDGLPFMPEMIPFIGKRFRIYKSAHKTCDTISDYVIRRMDNAFHLEDLRCDGQAHGGCEAGCLLFWKGEWLKPVESGQSNGAGQASQSGLEFLSSNSRRPGSTEADPCYRCQTTELLRATREVRRRDRWDPRFYLKDLTSGNVPLSQFLWYGLIAIFNSFTLKWFGRRYPQVCGLAGSKTPTVQTGLQPGELVQVRSKQEIMTTLNADRRNRGMWFDVEMVPHCGSEQRVLRRVQQIVDEKTGRLVRLANPCIVLDGVTCSGNLSASRMFCPRSIYPYWREIWLKRPGESRAPESATSS